MSHSQHVQKTAFVYAQGRGPVASSYSLNTTSLSGKVVFLSKEPCFFYRTTCSVWHACPINYLVIGFRPAFCGVLVPQVYKGIHRLMITSDRVLSTCPDSEEHLIIVTELLRDNLYEFSKYNRECGILEADREIPTKLL